jgi:hypothetical protein
MTHQKIPGYTEGSSGSLGDYGEWARDQAFGIRDVQGSFTTGSIDEARETQDNAWEKKKGDKKIKDPDVEIPLECAGDGECGIVTPVEKDTLIEVDGVCPEGTVGKFPKCVPKDVPIDVPVPKPTPGPVEELSLDIMTKILIASIIAIAAAAMVRLGLSLMANPYTFAAGLALFLAGIALAIFGLVTYAIPALVKSIQLMTTWNQLLLGTIFSVGSGLAILALGMAMAGATLGPISVAWVAAAAVLLASLGTMFKVEEEQLKSISFTDAAQSENRDDYLSEGEEEVNQAESDAESARRSGEAKDASTEGSIRSVTTKKGKQAKAIDNYKKQMKAETGSAKKKQQDALDKAESERKKAEYITK